MHYGVLGTVLIVALLMFCLLMSVRGMMEGLGTRTYTYINGRLKEKKGGFLDYHTLAAFLKRNGAEGVLGSLADPVKYLGLCIVLFVTGMLLGGRINYVVMVIAGCMAAALPGSLILYHNIAWNDKALGDIKRTYQFIARQTAAGVYISDALLECYEAVENRRLKKALKKLCDDIATENNIYKALDAFSESFDNAYIDTLCVIIRQAMESGHAIDLLNDMAEQLKEMEDNLLLKKRESLSRKIAILQLLFFTGMMVLLIYAIAYDMKNLILNF